MLKEIFYDSLKISKIYKGFFFFMENHLNVTGWQELILPYKSF